MSHAVVVSLSLYVQATCYSVSQSRICSDNGTSSFTEIGVAGYNCYVTQYTDILTKDRLVQVLTLICQAPSRVFTAVPVLNHWYHYLLTYLCPSLPVEQRPSTTPSHRTLFWTALAVPVQLVPCCFSSASVSRLEMLRGRPLFLSACGFQIRAWRVVSVHQKKKKDRAESGIRTQVRRCRGGPRTTGLPRRSVICRHGRQS